MRRFAALLVLLTTPASAASGGALDTLMLGRYDCERPGAPVADAIAEPAAGFAVVTASRYRTPRGEGTYLLTGDTVTMTSGPLAGTRLLRLRGHFLRRIDEGRPGPVRCVLARGTDRH